MQLLPWRRKKIESGERFSLDEYAQMVETFMFNGMVYNTFGQTLKGSHESIEADFVSYVNSAYKTNGIVFACMLARRSIFTEARFQFRSTTRQGGRPGPLFGTPALAPLERPFPGGVTSDLLSRMIDDADLAGNWYGVRDGSDVVRLRPDWVDIALEPRIIRGQHVGYKKVGYLYYEGGNRGSEPAGFLLSEVSHFAPNPDPLASWRGMSWLTPVLREIMSDKQATLHKQKFFENGATPNMVVKLPEMTKEKFDTFKKQTEGIHKGAHNAYKTMYLGGGADLEVVGADFQQLDFKRTQGAGETRIAAAAGIHPVIVGISEGLAGSSLNQGNFSAARRLTGDKTIRPLWRNAAASLEQIVPAPGGSELWYDERDVAFLRDDQKDVAEIQAKQAAALRQLTDAGYSPDAAVRYLQADDLSELIGEHSGLFSVQLQPPGADEGDDSVRVQVSSPVEFTELVSKGWRPTRRQPLELEAA